MLPLVDTHQHLWDLEKLTLPWLEGLEVLNKSYLMDDYLQATAHQNVVKTVYMEVNAAPTHRELEVEWITELCQVSSNPMAGAVIAGEPQAADFKTWVNRHKKNPYIKGIRSVLHVPQTPRGFCLDEKFMAGVRYLGEVGLLFDICIRPAELNDACQLVQKCPETLFVLDHCGNADPNIVRAKGAPENQDHPMAHGRTAWLDGISKLAEQPNVICKISGIVARATEPWSAQDLAPTIDHCLNAFGAERVVFGGDWPVCLLGASFEQWATALRKIIQARSQAEQKKLLSENALRIYQL